MLTQEQIIEINTAYDAALQRYNNIAARKIAKSDANRDVLIKYLRGQNIQAYPDWTYEQIWNAALLQCADQLETIHVETTEERNHRLAKRDAEDGSRRYNTEKSNTNIDLKAVADKISDMLTGKTVQDEHAKKPVASRTVYPSLDANPDHLENMSVEDKALLKKLSGPETRIWMAKLRQKIAEEAQAAAPVKTGNVRLRGEPRA